MTRKTSVLPRAIKVGPFDFAVEPWSRTQMKAENRYGESDFEDFVIRIVAEGVPLRVTAETLLHEIMHCVCFAWHIKPGEETEEPVVAKMSLGLAAVIRDNPELTSFLAAAIA